MLQSGLVNRASRCGLYFAQTGDGELDTGPLLSRLWSMRRMVAVPVVSAGGLMDFYQVKPTTPLCRNRYGIEEPQTGGARARAATLVNPRSLSLLFVPLVVFDDLGNRLGMGAGYYDRYLGRLAAPLRPLIVGLAHHCQRSPEPLARRSWDIPLDGVVTEAGWQPFSPRAKVI